jgi:hypothetical protein
MGELTSHEVKHLAHQVLTRVHAGAPAVVALQQWCLRHACPPRSRLPLRPHRVADALAPDGPGARSPT